MKKLDYSHYESMSLARHMNINKARPGQKGAINAVLHILENEPNTRSIPVVLPCRYGKTWTIHSIVNEVCNSGLFSTCLVVAPNATIVKQFHDPDDIHEWMTLFEVNNVRGNYYHKPIKAGQCDVASFFRNNEYVHLMTTQMFQQNYEAITEWNLLLKRKYGTRGCLLIGDEIQMLSEGNEWGYAYNHYVESGGYGMPFTGTGFRSDGNKIVGFEEVILDEKTFENKRPVAKDGDEWVMQHSQVTKRTKQLIPRYEYPYSKAWDEKTLCRIKRIPINAAVITKDASLNILEQKSLADMNTAEIQKTLSLANRNPHVITEVMKELDKILTVMKSPELPRPQAIVFTEKDRSGDEPNGHAVQCRRIMETLFKHKYKTAICTMKSDSPDKTMEAFCLGDIDILFVKDMASAGITAKYCKVGCDLGNTLATQSVIQRYHRPATFVKGVEFCYIITVDDVIRRNIAEEFFSGNIDTTTDTITEELYQTRIKAKEESEQPVTTKEIKDARVEITVKDVVHTNEESPDLRHAYKIYAAHPGMINRVPPDELVAALVTHKALLTHEGTSAPITPKSDAEIQATKITAPLAMNTGAQVANVNTQINGIINNICNLRGQKGSLTTQNTKSEFGMIWNSLKCKYGQKGEAKNIPLTYLQKIREDAQALLDKESIGKTPFLVG